jgi:hypothetical protein
MRVNRGKTKIMAVSSAQSFKAKAHMIDRDSGNEVSSVDTLCTLGFNIDSNGGIWTQVRKLRGRLRQRAWTLRAAKKNGMSEAELIKIYTTRVRPAVEANAVVLYSMLSAEQSEMLERMQTLALRNIYGPGLSAAKMRTKAGVERLEVRREKMAEKFVKKTMENPRFAHWFVERREPVFARRSEGAYRKYEEKNARTDRRFNSPLFALRRLANKMERK